MKTIWKTLRLSLSIGICLTLSAAAQNSNSLQEQVNHGTVKLVTGGIIPENTDLTSALSRRIRENISISSELAGDVASFVDKKDTIRVLPVMGYGSISNIRDLLYLRGVDFCIANSDVLTHIRRRRPFPASLWKLHHVLTLYNETFHIIAPEYILNVSELSGLPVATALPGSPAEISTRTLFDILGVNPNFVHYDWDTAIEMARNRQVAAVIYPARKGDAFIRKINPIGLQMLNLSHNELTRNTYHKAVFEDQDYPNFIRQGNSVESLQYGSVIVSYNWPDNSPRFKNSSMFIERLLGSIEKIKWASRHPIWRNIDIESVPPGWTRHVVAKEWLESYSSRVRPGGDVNVSSVGTLNREYLDFLKHMKRVAGLAGAKDHELRELFEQFRDWQRQKLSQKE